MPSQDISATRWNNLCSSCSGGAGVDLPRGAARAPPSSESAIAEEKEAATQTLEGKKVASHEIKGGCSPRDSRDDRCAPAVRIRGCRALPPSLCALKSDPMGCL